MAPSTQLPKEIDPVWLAASKLRRRHLDDCVKICTDILAVNQLDQVRPLCLLHIALSGGP